MRPIKLTMQSFGSYGKETTIDFTKTSQNLFLISGDTGAGKTTIFDAIVFALYGEASSTNNKKDGLELQSQFVGYDTKPYVELEFSEKRGEECGIYTVRRVPKHMRPLKRGSGYTDESEVVSLTMPDGSEYPQKETDKKLEQIVGLTKEQFMQVAMIAQGEFMEILRARTDDKKVIFRKLFNTELFQKIVYELDRRCKEKKTEIAQIRTSCQTEAGHIVAPEDYDRAELLSEQKRKILGSDKLSVTDMEKLLEELKILCESLSEKKEAAQENFETVSEIRDAKRDEYVNAGNLLKFFEQLEKAEKDLAECSSAEKDIQEAAKLIRQIDAAYEIQAVFQRYDYIRKKAEDTEKKITDLKQKLPELETLFEESSKREAEAKIQQETELETFTKVSERVNAALENLKKIENANADLKVKEEAYRQSDATSVAVTKKLKDLEAQEQKWREQSDKLAEADTLLALWKVRSEEADNMATEVNSVKEAEQDVENQRKKAEKAQREYEKARDAFEKKNEVYIAGRTSFLDAQAGFLAKEKLKPGKPCPVCGSTEHPNPCELSEEHQALTREIIEELSEEVGKLQKKQEDKSREAGTSLELLNEKETNFKEVMDKLHGHMSKNIPDVPDDFNVKLADELLDRWKEEIRSEGEKLKKDAETLASVKKSLSGVDERKSELKEAADKAAKGADEAREALTVSKTNLTNLEKEKDYSTAEEANAAFESAEKAKKEKDKEYQKANKTAMKAKQEKERAETLLEKYRNDIGEQTKEQILRKDAYQKIMAEKDISESEWKDLTEMHHKTEMADIQTKIDAHNKKKAAAESVRVSAKEAIGEQERPHLEELEKAKNKSEQELVYVQGILEQYKEEYKVNYTAYQALAPKMEERSRIMEEYRRMDTLYSLLAGKVTGARMDIEAFVQRYYLEKILYAANSRFLDMSAGQFELRMYDIEKAGEGRNRGLDLMVYSTVTGKEREVRTLSGGESFMAALALALGMADQIQENSAAINLDVMFIDEGFGSLDNHSRNQAVKVLQQMAGGSKLIGIISHVTELKQEIEDQLIVRRDENGSHVRWQNS
ncbi:MAG: AAA family ATPase [Lachnospiraceae bacterium]|nr:AAA family ATPase [Lachnospiraceae bacterium]